MYLPKNKYRIEVTYGGEYIDSSGKDYAGSIIKTADGTVFAGNSLNNVQGIVTEVEEKTLLNIERAYNDYYGPTEKDYEKGSYIRYFLRDSRNGKFVEVNNKQWNIKRKLKYLESGFLIWKLKGPVNDGKLNGIPFIGTSTKNKNTVRNLEKDYPGISEFFKSTSEFVR